MKPSPVFERRGLPMAVPVYVEAEGTRWLAYQDEQGAWRHFYGRHRILGALKRVSYEPGKNN